MTELFMAFLGISLSTGILAVLLMILSPLFNHRYAAKWRFWIWAVLALRLIIPFGGFQNSAEPTRPKQPLTDNAVSQKIEQPRTNPIRRIEFVIPETFTEPIVSEIKTDNYPEKKSITPLEAVEFIWAAGAAICFLTQIIGFIIFKIRIIRRGRQITDGMAANVFEKVREEAGVRGNLRLIGWKDAPCPMIMGYFRPVLVLPEDDYTEEQLSFIIRHEIIHYKRCDVWFKMIFAVAVSLHWFNPAVWLMRSRADFDMELSVDEKVVGQSSFEVRKAYTEVLYSTVGKSRAVSNALSTNFNGGKMIMKKRFYNILTKINKKNGALLLSAVILLAITAGALIGCTVNTNANRPSAKEVEALKQILSEQVGDEKIYAFAAYDYDGNGSYEAFGVTGEPYFDSTLWYVADGQAYQVEQNEFAVSDDDESSHILDLETCAFYTVECSSGGNSSGSAVYGVRGGMWYEDSISGCGSWISKTDSGDITIIDDDSDAFYDEYGNAAGSHTYKTYYLYYDNGFKEYIGSDISSEELLKYGGADKIIDGILSSGATVRNILFRQNGIVNINYYTEDEDGWTHNMNKTLRITGSSLTEIEEGEGVYEPAFIEKIAAYPGATVVGNSGLEWGDIKRTVEDFMLYERAFTYASFGFSSNDPADGVEIDGDMYFPVTEEGFVEWQQLYDFMHGLFTDSLAEKIIDRSPYREYGGKTYTLDVGGYGWSISSETYVYYDSGKIELWRPLLSEGDEGEYCITSMTLEDGRISGYNNFYTDEESGYQPMADINDVNKSFDERSTEVVGKVITEKFEDFTISVTVPESWNYFVVANDGIIEPQHVGIQLYDGEVPEQKELYGGKLFVAAAANGRAETYLGIEVDIKTPFTMEAYTTESGRGMKLYYIDGKLEFATFDDYPEMCVFFDLNESDDLNTVFAIIDSIDFKRPTFSYERFSESDAEVTPAIEMYDYKTASELADGDVSSLEGIMPDNSPGTWYTINVNGVEYYYGQQKGSEDIKLYSYAIVSDSYSLGNGIRVGMTLNDVYEICGISESSPGISFNPFIFPHRVPEEGGNVSEYRDWGKQFTGALLIETDRQLAVALLCNHDNISAITFFEP